MRSRPAWLLAKIARERRSKVILKRGTIPQRTIDAFLDRDRRDFRAFLKMPDRKLDALASKLPTLPPIWHGLRTNQKACLIIGARERRFFFMNDTGTGKTLLTIALAEYFYKLGEIDHMLVLVPRRPNKYEWADEIEKHSPNTPYVVLEGSTKNKWQQIEENPDALLFIESYAGLPYLCTTLKEKKKAKGNERVLNLRLAKKLAQFFQGLTTDEAVQGGLGSKDTLPWRICRQLTNDEASIYFTLTGTPFGRDPILVWPQMWLVDRGYSLGENQAIFRSVFYTAQTNPMGAIEYTYQKKKKRLLHDFLADASIRFEADSRDLPRVNSIQKYCMLPGDASTYYEQAKKRFIAAHGNYEEQKNAFLRMRQISSGYCGFWDDEHGTKASLEFDDNPKLDALLTWVQGIDEQYKQIIFYEFTWSGLKIAAELKKLKIGYAHLYGGTKDAQAEKHRFTQDEDCSVLIMQNSFGVGLNVQIAKYAAFYEAPVSPITRKQCWRRIERQESTHSTVFIADMIMRGTVDERILEFHKEGEDLFKAIIQGKVKL
jgi:SNF2 family DNA or RNA helicase